MKKLLMMLALAFAITTATQAQTKEKKEAAKIPSTVMQAFEKKHPGVKARWELENGNYEAGFKQGKTETSALYNAEGVLLETETEIPVENLPGAIIKHVETMKWGKIKEASKITKANGTVEYEAEVRSGDAIFDSNGKFLKMDKK